MLAGTPRIVGGSGGGGGGPVTGLTGTATQVVYIDNSGNGTGDALFTRDSATNDTIIHQVSGDFTQGMDLGTLTIGPLAGTATGNVLSRVSSTGLLGTASIGAFDGTNFGYDTVGVGSFVTDSTGQLALTFSDPTNGIRFSYFDSTLLIGSDGGLTPIGVQWGASDNATYWNKMWLPKDDKGFLGSELPGSPTIYSRVEVSPTTVEMRGNTNGTSILLDDAAQMITAKVNDTIGSIVNGLTIDGTSESNLAMFDTSTGSGAGHFVTNTAGNLSADMGWQDGLGAAYDVIVGPGSATVNGTDGIDTSNLIVSSNQITSKSKTTKIDSILDRTLASFNTQTNLIWMGDLGTNYSGSTLSFNTDTNTAEWNLNVKGGATTIISNFNMNPVTGNVLSWDADTADNFITKFEQSNNLLGAGVIGSSMTYAEATTPNSSTIAVGDFTAIGGGNFTAAMVSDNGTSSGRVFADPANGVLNIFDDADYADTFSSRLSVTSTNAQLAYEDVTNTKTSQIFASSTESVIGHQNASLISTSVNVQDGLILFNYNASSFLNINGVAGTVEVTKPFILKGYTVATLPTGSIGMIAYVTDATAPTFGAAVVGGGAVTIKVFYDGAAWIVG